MDILKIYEDLQRMQVKVDQLPMLNEGYRFYLERRKMGWIPIEPPCRLVYRHKNTVSMVIMPFLIPEYANKIWGIEVCGVMFSLTYDEVRMYTDRDVNDNLQEQSEFLFGKKGCEERRLELPILSNFILFRRNHEAVEDTLTLLTYQGVKVKDFGNSRYWIGVKDSSELPLVTKFDGQRYLSPFRDKIGKVRPVLHASTRLDCFCAIDNKFAVPKQEAFEKCLQMISED